MQCKDIPDLPIMKFLAERRRLYGQYDCGVVMNADTWGTGKYGDRRLANAMPEDVPYKLRYAKMMMLARRGLVDEFRNGGFRITDLGRHFVAEAELLARGYTLIPGGYAEKLELLNEAQTP